MDFDSIYRECHRAGMEAGQACTPSVMIIPGYSPITEGPCGFAWVTFPGNTAWGRWAKKVGVARKSYPCGMCVWVSMFGQSHDRKLTYARAFADRLNELVPNARAYADSRLD